MMAVKRWWKLLLLLLFYDVKDLCEAKSCLFDDVGK